MKRLMNIFLFGLLISGVVYARGETEAKSNMTPTIGVDNSSSINKKISNTATVYGSKVTVTWSPSPQEDYYDVVNLLVPPYVFPYRVNFDHYVVIVTNKNTGDLIKTYTLPVSGATNYTKLQLDDFNKSGIYQATIYAGCIDYFGDDANATYLGPWTSNTSSVTIIVDHEKPKPPDPPPDLSYYQKSGIWEKTSGDKGSPGYVTIRFIAPYDSGPNGDNTGSGVAGYKVYEETPSGDSYVTGFFNDAASGQEVSAQIPLNEGEHKIKITAIDYISYLENNSDLSAGSKVIESDKSPTAYFCVDRSGPVAIRHAL